MKKLFLSLTVLGLVMTTSCKKAAETVGDVAESTADVVGDVAEGAAEVVSDVAEGTVDTAGDAVSGVASLFDGVPNFENAELTELVKQYGGVAMKMVDASKAGDAGLLETLTGEASGIMGKINALRSVLSTGDVELLNPFLKKIAESLHQ